MKLNGTYVLGDIHADWPALNTFINKKNPEIIMSAGDFGYWPRYKGPNHSISNIKNKDTKIYWCDGNHEDFYSIRDNILTPNKLEVAKNIFYQPRGSVLTLPDGRNVMFIGGAWSIDYQNRVDGVSWFEKEELIWEKDIENIYNYKEDDIDLIISHTAPTEFVLGVWGNENYDPSRKVLSHVLDYLKPKQWIFGHWHLYKTDLYNYKGNTSRACRWTCLNMSYNTNWWLEI